MLKKISHCRSCKSNHIKDVFNLGSQYLTGVFPKKNNTKISQGDLSLCLCKKCSLLQLKYNFDHKEMYGDNYGYMSSLNNSMKEHLEKKSKNLISKYPLNNVELIIYI